MRRKLQKRLEKQMFEYMALLDSTAEMYRYFFIAGQEESETENLFDDLGGSIQRVRDYLDPEGQE